MYTLIAGVSGFATEIALEESSLSVDTSSFKLSEAAQKHVARITSNLALRIAGRSRFL